MRVSKAVTGGTGFIITDFSYHGVTDVLSGMSPEDGGPLRPASTRCLHLRGRAVPKLRRTRPSVSRAHAS